MSSPSRSAELLGSDGPLAHHLDGFLVRPEQQAMADAVELALQTSGILIAEAGTGTGKTFAYLVPALRCGQKVLVSTGTKALQDQLYHRDIPLVRKALSEPVRVALLKGRANYLCPYRLGKNEREGRLRSPEMAHQLALIRRWAGRTRHGDIAEMGDIPEDASVWVMATSTTDNCLGSECPELGDCYVMKARKAAQEADLLVVNHHLFFADMAVREEGFGEVLPGVNAFIFDEAHQLPDIAGNFFGVSVTGRQLLDLARDAHLEMLTDARDMEAIPMDCARLEHAVREFRLALGNDARRAAWRAVRTRPEVSASLAALQEALTQVTAGLELAAPRGKGLEQCWARSADLSARLAQLAGGHDPNYVAWFETHSRGFVLRLTPVDIAPNFRAYMQGRVAAWVFTSATLAAGESFEHFTVSLGIDDATTARWESPFDYGHQALMYLPPSLPDPGSPGYSAATVEAALPVLEASQGRAFFLVTSWRALQDVSTLLRRRIIYPLLVQGEMPRAELLQRFRDLGNAVLVGTSSFWEGVDVRGEALSCVIIDKLPFASPDDPVLQARMDLVRAKGGNPFRDLQMPQAIIALKQGSGRLIRAVDDRGVLMLCDPRLLSKSYGRLFLDSLPAMPRTQDVHQVQQFFEQQHA